MAEIHEGRSDSSMEQEIKVGMDFEDKEAKVEYLCKRCASAICDRHYCPIYDAIKCRCGRRFWSESREPELDELIKKWEAFDSAQALKKFLDHKYMPITASPVETIFNREKVANLLYIIYQNVSPHLSAEGVAARNYCFEELGKELFGEGDMPAWMRR